MDKITYRQDLLDEKKEDEFTDEENPLLYEERPSTAKFFAESSVEKVNEQKLANRSINIQKAYVKYYENMMA